jgi:AcrR family transcriptional regulator
VISGVQGERHSDGRIPGSERLKRLEEMLKTRAEHLIKVGEFTEKGRVKIGEICREAALLFSKKGYQEATLADVSKAVGITKAGIYHYFSTKEELLFHVLYNYMDGVVEKAKANFASKVRPEEKIRRFIRDHIEYLDENLHESRVIINQWHNLAPEYRDIIRAQQRSYITLLRTEIQNLLGDVAVDAEDNRLTTYILMGMCNAPYNWYRAGGAFSPERITEKIYDIFMGQLFKKPARKKR